MKYVIAGKSESFWKYIKINNYKVGKDVIYAKTLQKFSKIEENDVVVLLPGWWGKTWTEDAIKKLDCNNITFQYLDGKFGDMHRKSLESDNIDSRFDILDL